MVGGQPSLFHRGRGQCREADDVADGVDVLHLGPELVVDEDPPAALDLDAGFLQVEPVGLPWRPAEYITVSAGICLPLARVVMVPEAPTSTAVTSSPNRNVTARSRRWNFSASMISGSQKSNMSPRFSTTVTLVPSAANIEAYSMPITPAPTTTIDAGSDLRSRIPSESSTRRRRNPPRTAVPAWCRWR